MLQLACSIFGVSYISDQGQCWDGRAVAAHSEFCGTIFSHCVILILLTSLVSSFISRLRREIYEYGRAVTVLEHLVSFIADDRLLGRLAHVEQRSHL